LKEILQVIGNAKLIAGTEGLVLEPQVAA